MSLANSVRARVVVDIDCMDPDVAARHSSTTAPTFCDMTSNQAIVYGQSIRPEQTDTLQKAITAAKTKFESQDQIVDHAVDVFTVLLAKAIYPYLTGRCHAQTSPSTAFDTEKTIAHAKELVSVFEANGIPKERVCIKIPATAESVVACQYLEKIGIRTLSTCLFSIPQALAAHQAGCLYIAPYFNELRVHFEPEIWKKYDDTAKEHPMSKPILDIVSTYRAIGAKTLVIPASIVTTEEVIGLITLQPDHLTLSGTILDSLAALPEAALPEPLLLSTPAANDVVETNYLADGGAQLRDALAADAETSRKLDDALKIFGDMEAKLKALIRSQL
ncbi:aldolase [Amylostereum chailletii]|nr:aldolase [Amylostereum chailletii]